jgi:hypothetical protein
MVGKTRAAQLTAGIAVILGLSSCASVTSCPAVTALSPPVLAYPIPNATDVPDAPGELLLSGVSDGGYTLVPASGPIISAGQAHAAPSPLPSPIDPNYGPPYAEPPYTAVTIPPLAPAMTYSVVFTRAATAGPCGQPELNDALGSFTTR